MNNHQEITVLAEFTQILDRLGIVYAIGGSMASSAYGAVRFTQDADISVASFQAKAKAFLKAVEENFYISEAAMMEALEFRRSFNIIHLATAFKIDIFINPDTDFGKQVLQRRRSLSFSHQKNKAFSFVSPEDIILLKLQWYKDGGEVSERQWSDILNVLSVQSEKLDQNYLKTVAAQLSVEYLLAKAQDELGPA